MITLNYIGSKKTLFQKIYSVCTANIPNLQEKVFLDIFAGTGTVGFNMEPHVKRIVSNDLEYYSFVINSALLKTPFTEKLKKLIEKCNNLTPTKGLVYQHFSPPERMFFTTENAMKCDAIREYIQELYNIHKINLDEFNFLVASLLTSIDTVANTTSVYGAFLKNFKTSATKPIVMKAIHERNIVKTNIVFNQSAEEIKHKCDILYLDPPYNARQYGANYSPLNYIAKWSKDIEITGKTGLIKGYNKSEFCRKATVKAAFTKILDNIDCKYVMVSYNNEGLLPFEQLKELLQHRGELKLYKIPYKKYKSQITQENELVYEWLWFLEKSEKISFEEIIL